MVTSVISVIIAGLASLLGMVMLVPHGLPLPRGVRQLALLVPSAEQAAAREAGLIAVGFDSINQLLLRVLSRMSGSSDGALPPDAVPRSRLPASCGRG